MRTRLLTATVLAATILLAMAGVAAAKEGAQAALDAPLPPDAEPGSTIEVTWKAWYPDGAAGSPVRGSPLFIRLTSIDGSETVEASGRESTGEPGHYVATVTIPQGGVSLVEIGLRGQSCVEGDCMQHDILFALEDADRLPQLGATGSAGAAPAGSDAGSSVGIALAIALAGLAFAVAATVRPPRRAAPPNPAPQV